MLKTLLANIVGKKYYCLYPLLLLWTHPVFADNINDIFTPKAIRDGTDKSILLLGQIFGSVDGVLQGYGSQIMGTVFGVFNSAVIGLGGIIILYTLVVSTLNTAHEGEFLGRRWNSLAIPFRSCAGILLLLPKASGYSLIQIFVMWVVVQGVGAGDTVWNRALDYIIHAGTLSPSKFSGDALTPVVNTAQKILQNQICVAGMQYYWNTEHPDCQQATLYPSAPMLNHAGVPQYISQFPSDDSLPQACKNQYFQSAACGVLTIDKDADASLNEARLAAIWQMVTDLGSYANTVVQAKQVTDSTEAGMALMNATLDYTAILLPTLQRSRDRIDAGIANSLRQSQDEGWIIAGRYYQTLASLRGDLQNISDKQPKITTPDVSKRNDGISQSSWSTIQKYKMAINSSIVAIANSKLSAGASSIMVNPDVGSIGGDAGGVATRVIIGIFTLGMLEWAHGAFESAFDKSDADPIYGVILIGNNLINAAGTMWLVCGLILMALSAAAAIMSCTGPPYWMLLIFTVWFVPVASTIMVMMLTAGCVLAFYVPIVPYMIFFFGSLGWFLGVIESMVAAPLIALGIAHPDGQHEFFGRAEPAVMLLVNIFLRPSLMILGLIVGILLSYVGIRLLNLGFGPTYRSLPSPDGSGFVSAMKTFAVAIVYTSLVVLIINKAFSAITEVPNKVMRWIGSQEQLGESTADLGQIQSAVSGAASSYGKGISGQIGAGAQVATQHGKPGGKKGGGLEVGSAG